MCPLGNGEKKIIKRKELIPLNIFLKTALNLLGTLHLKISPQDKAEV